MTIRNWQVSRAHYGKSKVPISALTLTSQKQVKVVQKEFRGKVLSALIPHGTDSGRLASREHHFWCGLQLQNMPTGSLVKQTLRAPAGFYFAECDLEQAETRDTAYITGDKNLIDAVNSDRDFSLSQHSSILWCAYESVYDDKLKKTINKKLRDLAKQ